MFFSADIAESPMFLFEAKEPTNKIVMEKTKKTTLSWAPAEGAVSYRIIIFQDNIPISEATTNQNFYTLNYLPGEYRWVVFPISKDGVVSQVAIVESRLII